MTEQKKKNWFERHKVLSVLGAFFVLWVIISAANGVNNTSTTERVTPTDTATTETKTKYAVNEPATVDKRTVTVTNMQRNYATGNPYLAPESGKEFVVVTVEITNNGDDTLSYNTYDFKMQDSNGVQQSESWSALTEGRLSSGSLAPGGKVTGKLAYEVPAGDAGLKLLFQNPSLFNNTTITFSL